MDGSWWHQPCRDILLFVSLAAAVCAIVQNFYLEAQLYNEGNQVQEYKAKLESLEQQIASLHVAISNQKWPVAAGVSFQSLLYQTRTHAHAMTVLNVTYHIAENFVIGCLTSCFCLCLLSGSTSCTASKTSMSHGMPRLCPFAAVAVIH